MGVAEVGAVTHATYASLVILKRARSLAKHYLMLYSFVMRIGMPAIATVINFDIELGQPHILIVV